MRLTDRLRHRVIRWDSLALALTLVLPLGASSVLGALWLYERGWFLYFALGSVGFYALVRLVLAALRWRSGADSVRMPTQPPFAGQWSWVYPTRYIGANGFYEIKLIAEDVDGLSSEEVHTIEVVIP